MLGRLDEAEADYERFRRLEGLAFFADARLFFLRGDRARARDRLGDGREAARIRSRADAELAATRRSVVKGSWIEAILECAAGERTPEALVASADPKNPEQVCEAFYYAGESCLLRGKIDPARHWFEKCVETDLVFDPTTFPPAVMNEYFLARFRVAQLAGDQGPPKPLAPWRPIR